MAGTVGNADTWTVTFTDAAGAAAAPDSGTSIVFTASRYDDGSGVLDTETQAVADAVSAGVYEYAYTPTAAGPYYVKATATVGGAPQATPATLREVAP